MQEITHCHNQRPVYETENGDVYGWDNPLEVTGEPSNPSTTNYHPFIFDIETSAELGQRPTLLVGYNTLESRLVVLYSHGYQDYTLSMDRVKEMIKDFDISKVSVHNLSISNFEKFILKPIAEWNKEAKKRKDSNRMSLVAHNAVFDIPMMGTPDDELLDNPKIGQQYEQAVGYNDIKMIGHRAGQFGHIFTFLDSAKNYESMHIPVADTMVSAQAMWIPAKLKSACEKMNVDLEVSEADEHGNLNDEYVEYCINDVIATKKLYDKLSYRVNEMFGKFPLEHIYSTASIGKYVLRNMGYTRVGYEEKAVDIIAPSYFGGRTDAEITGEVVEDLRYTDILSQYPTASALTDVWSFMQAKEVGIERVTASELPEAGDLTNPNNWEKVANYYVKVKPKGATLPVRTPHLDDTTKVVTSIVESDIDLQYHYMDVIAADLIDGERKCEIVAAWKVTKKGTQELEATNVAGVNLDANDNVMAKCIESRKEIQVKEGGKNEKTLSLKIVANSLYGVSAERIVKEINEGERHDFASERGFYNPHVATTITASGRLMLALGERIAKDAGGDLVYCDTDSLILPSHVTGDVIEAFSNLNPYSGVAGDMDVLEDEKGVSANLYAVGTKKYIFFDDNGEPLEVKEHGLGNYDNLRDEDTINRLWATIMYHDLGYNPLNCDILYGKMDERVLWSFTASTRSMRVMIDKMTNDYVRYGDWLQSTLAFDNTIRYIALNLMEKNANDEICKVTTEDENVVSATNCLRKEMDRDNRVKTVRDVVMKFVQDSIKDDGRPRVKVVELKPVTKEATSRKDIFISNLERTFRNNIETASDFLFA